MNKQNEDFDAALDRFVAYLHEAEKKHIEEKFPSLEPKTFEVMRGRKYARIVDVDSSQRSAFCFVNMENGDVLMAATWKAPAKHARGTIFTDDPEKYGVTNYGARYL